MPGRVDVLRSRLNELLEKRKTAKDALDAVMVKPTAENRGLHPDETVKFKEQEAAITAVDGELDGIQAELNSAEDLERRETAANALRQKYGQVSPDAPGKRSASVTVTSEPMTYDQDSPHSYFLDLARAQFRSDGEAASRLQRHGQEMDVELPAREKRRREQAEQEMLGLDRDILTRRQRKLGQRSVFEKRANPNRTDGQGGYFVPPIWMIDEFIDLPRFGRPFANRVRNMSLPAGTDSINVPKVATGSLTGSQSADGQQVVSQDMTDTFINAPVRTIAGQQDVAIQLLDQSPASFDEIVFADLIADYNMQLDIQCLNGSGLAGQLLGVYNVTGTNTVAANATQDIPSIYPNLAMGLSKIATQRKAPPDTIMLSPSLWFWIISRLDTQNRPLVNPVTTGVNTVTSSQEPVVEGPVGVLLGVTAALDGNMPATLGGSSNEQRPFSVRADDLFLWEGSMRTRVLQEVLSGTLQVRFQLFNYAAFMPNRRPTAISIYNGAGYVVPTGF